MRSTSTTATMRPSTLWSLEGKIAATEDYVTFQDSQGMVLANKQKSVITVPAFVFRVKIWGKMMLI